MVKQNLSNISSFSESNPLIIIVILIILLIIILAIFRGASPFLNLGFGVNAHIGDLKGSFELEAFKNYTPEEEGSSMLKDYYVQFPPNFNKNLPISKLFFPPYLNNIGGLKVNVMKTNNSFPYLVYADESTEEDKGTPLNYVPQSGVRSNIYLPIDFVESSDKIYTSLLIQSNQKNKNGNYNMIKVSNVILYTDV